jgi:hypothetical protein
MNVRLDHLWTGTDRAVQTIAVAAVVVTALGMLLLVRAALGGGVDHVTVRVDNRTGLGLEVDAVDAAGAVQGLGTARARVVTSIDEVPDQGRTWTFVAAYGGQEVFRQTLAREDLARGGWTVLVPASTTSDLERAGFR